MTGVARTRRSPFVAGQQHAAMGSTHVPARDSKEQQVRRWKRTVDHRNGLEQLLHGKKKQQQRKQLGTIGCCCGLAFLWVVVSLGAINATNGNAKTFLGGDSRGTTMVSSSETAAAADTNVGEEQEARRIAAQEEGDVAKAVAVEESVLDGQTEEAAVARTAAAVESMTAQEYLHRRVVWSGYDPQTRHWTAREGDSQHGPEKERPLEQWKNTLVTAFYRVRSKRRSSWYLSWMKNLCSLQDAMIVFTTPQWIPRFATYRQFAANRTLLIALPLNETFTVLEYGWDFWQAQREMDPENHLGTGHKTYVIWDEKLHWLQRASEWNPFGSEFFAWVDVGYFRDETYQGKELIRVIGPDFRENQLMLLDTWSFDPGARERVAAGFMGGYPAGIQRAATAFYQTLQTEAQAGAFVGKEQRLLHQVCQNEPDLCYLVAADRKPSWFYMAYFVHHGKSANNETQTSAF